MRYVYCTLFDKNYLVKGLVTVFSLVKCSEKYKIYILALDEETERIIADYKINNVIIIPFRCFFSEEFISNSTLKTNTELCWSCSANLLRYIFDVYQEEYCTYIDADMYFYSNPACLIDEMIESGKSVQIIEHRYTMDQFGKKSFRENGRFCVEFNTFRNDKDGNKVLNDWVLKVNHCCALVPDGVVFGDQKYLDDWPSQFDCVNICSNQFAGLAPWNIGQYSLVKKNETGLVVSISKSNISNHIIFYHFHGIQAIDNQRVDIAVYKVQWKVDNVLVETIYNDYFEELSAVQKYLFRKYNKKYDIFKMFEKSERSAIDELRARLSLQYIKNIKWNVEMRIKAIRANKRDKFVIKDGII